MAITNIKAKQIEKKRFSNKVYTINVELYEHNMADVKVDSKKRFRGRSRWHGGYILLDACLSEGMYEYVETLERMKVDKGAKRWLRRVLRHCLEGLSKPNGWIDWKKVDEKEDKRWHISRTRISLNVRQLQVMKRYIPDFFFAGNYRTDYLSGHNCKVIHTIDEKNRFVCKAKSVGARRRFEKHVMEHRFFYPKELLLNMLPELSESFYKQIVQERTMNDCEIGMEYTWYHGEKPELRISVNDATFDHYDIH
jgi:hypothetical protein